MAQGNRFTKDQIADDTEREMRGRPQKHGAAMGDDGLAPSHSATSHGGEKHPGGHKPAPPHRPTGHTGGSPHGSGASAETQVSANNQLPEDLADVNEPEPPSLESHHTAIAGHDDRIKAIEAKLGMNKQTAEPDQDDSMGFGEEHVGG